MKILWVVLFFLVPCLYSNAEETTDDYLPIDSVSTLPQIDERQIAGALVYPAEALSSGIEGRVILELFIDNEGQVQQTHILREYPPDMGFGEAAVNAFTGIKVEPARTANGKAVPVRYRYPVIFRVR